MGQCKYCGEDAGVFSHVHKEYEEKHDQGVTALDKLCQKMVRGFLAEYFTGQKPLQQVLQICRQITSVLPLSSMMMQETYA